MRSSQVLLLAVALLGCARHPLFEQQVRTSYAEAAALDTLHDYEVARLAAAAQLSRLEGLIAEERDDPELLALAARGWCRHAFYVSWDDREIAAALGDEGAARYHAERTLAGFERAAHYAGELLALTAEGYDPRDAQRVDDYLAQSFTEPEQASLLMWAGCAELGKSWFEGDAKRGSQSRAVARVLLEHALYLDDSTGDGVADLLLALTLAPAGDSKSVAAHLDRARKHSGGKLLVVEVARAVLIDCAARDEAAFVARLQRVLESPDAAPERRFDNVVAKRRARRYLDSAPLRASCTAER